MDVDFSVFFSDLHVFVFRVQKIGDLLLINLIEGQVHGVRLKIFLSLEGLEQVVQAVWDYALRFGLNGCENSHRVRFACAGLPVDKVRPTKSVQNVLDQRKRGRLEHLLLGRLGGKDS